jgi:AcrR family transcriptional regulator
MATRRTRARVQTAATRGGLLEAAEQVFAEKGIDGARIEDIAARAGVAVGTIYNYFGDSTELLKALITERRSELISRLDEATEEAKHQRAPWTGQVEAFIHITLQCMRDHHPFYAILMQCENRKAPPSLGSVSAEFYKRAEALIQRGVRLGLVREADAAILPAMLVTLCRAPLLHLRLKPGAAWTDDLSDQMLRFFSALVRSEPQPESAGQRRALGRPVWKALIKASKPRRQSR